MCKFFLEIEVVSRVHQYDFSTNNSYVYDVVNRERKARTMAAVLADYLPETLSHYDLLNVGGSAGIIDNYLADHFHKVVGIDIDEPAIKHAQDNYKRHNLSFQLADAMNLPFEDGSFDVVVCSHVSNTYPTRT